MQYDDVTTNPIWRPAAILKIVFWLYIRDVRLTRNFVWRSRITFRHRSRDQKTKFWKFKMADGRHFENGFIAISRPRIIQFWWNLVCRLKFWFKDGHMLIYKTRSSADADNGLDAFSGQSTSTNMVPFHMLHIVSYCAIVTLSLRFFDIRLQKILWPWNRVKGHSRSLRVISFDRLCMVSY